MPISSSPSQNSPEGRSEGAGPKVMRRCGLGGMVARGWGGGKCAPEMSAVVQEAVLYHGLHVWPGVVGHEVELPYGRGIGLH